MITLPTYTSHALQPLNITCFKPFKTSFRKERTSAMVKNNYLEPNKTTLVAWVDKALQQPLKKENMKLGFKVSRIWPLNLTTMVGKFGPSDVFTIIEKEEHEVTYHSNAIYESNNNETKAATKLLNITRTFQAKFPTILHCPPSPMPHYYVEMPNNLNIIANNHEEDQLVVDLEDVTLESKYLISSNHSEKVRLVRLLSLPTLPTQKIEGNKPLVDYSSSHVVILDQCMAILK
jgi:hypothetical protein